MKTDAFGGAAALSGAGGVTIYRLRALLERGVAPGLERLPFSIKVHLVASTEKVRTTAHRDPRNIADAHGSSAGRAVLGV